jgi:hypothetical protein
MDQVYYYYGQSPNTNIEWDGVFYVLTLHPGTTFYHGSGGMINSNIELPLGESSYQPILLPPTVNPSYYGTLEEAKVYSNSKTEYRNICGTKCVYAYILKKEATFLLIHVYNILFIYKTLLSLPKTEENIRLIKEFDESYGIFDVQTKEEHILNQFIHTPVANKIIQTKVVDGYRLTRSSSYEGDILISNFLCKTYGAKYVGTNAGDLPLKDGEEGTFHSEVTFCNPKLYLEHDIKNPNDWSYILPTNPKIPKKLNDYLETIHQIPISTSFLGSLRDLSIWKLFYFESLVSKYTFLGKEPFLLLKLGSFLSIISYLPLLFNTNNLTYYQQTDLSESTISLFYDKLSPLTDNEYYVSYLIGLLTSTDTSPDNFSYHTLETLVNQLYFYQKKCVHYFTTYNKETIKNLVEDYTQSKSPYLILGCLLAIAHILSLKSVYGTNKLRFAEEYRLHIPFQARSIIFPYLSNTTQKNKQVLHHYKDDTFDAFFIQLAKKLGYQPFILDSTTITKEYQDKLVAISPDLDNLQYVPLMNHLVLPSNIESPTFLYNTMETLFNSIGKYNYPGDTSNTFRFFHNGTSMLRRALHTIYFLSYFAQYKPEEYKILFPNKETKKFVIIASMMYDLFRMSTQDRNFVLAMPYKDIKYLIGNPEDNLFPDETILQVNQDALCSAVFFKTYLGQFQLLYSQKSILGLLPYTLAFPIYFLVPFQQLGNKDLSEELQITFLCTHIGFIMDSCRLGQSLLDIEQFITMYLYFMVDGNELVFSDMRANFYELEIITLESTGYTLTQRRGLRINIEDLRIQQPTFQDFPKLPCSLIQYANQDKIINVYGDSFETSFITIFKFNSEHLLERRKDFLQEFQTLLHVPEYLFVHYLK